MGQLPCRRPGGFAGFGEAVDQPDPECLVGFDLAPGEHDVQCAAAANQTGQSLGTSPAGDQAELDFGKPEPSSCSGDTQRARHRQLETAAQGEPFDGGDGDQGQGGEAFQHAAQRVAVLPERRRVDRRHVFDVGAGGEKAVIAEVTKITLALGRSRRSPSPRAGPR